MSSEWKQTSCYNCGVSCGLEVQIENNKVVSVRPDKASMRSLGGYCCRKGRCLQYFQNNKNRLDYPLKRVNGEYVRISWEQALSEIAEKTNAIREKYSPKAFGVYGVGLAVDQVAMYPLHDLADFLGTQWKFNPLSVEFVSPWWAHGKMFGRQFPPLEGEPTAEVFICWGANTFVSHNVGNARQHIRAAAEDPNRMFIAIDPCLSETARFAQMHIMPKNGTDCLMARALISMILDYGWEDKEYIEKYTTGFDKALKWYKDFDYKKAFEVCGVPLEQMQEFARILCTKGWGVHMDLGVYFNRHASLAVYLVDTLCVITGNAFKLNTNVIPHSYLSWGHYTDENTPGIWRTWKTNSFPTLSVYGGSQLQECMEDPNENERLRALFVVAGNPVRSFPDSNALKKDFNNLDLMVVVDIAMTETCRCADYVLPGTTGYERFGTTIFPGGWPYTTLTFKQQLLEKEAERRDDSGIFIDIMDACGFIPKIPQELYDHAAAYVSKGDRMGIIPEVEEYLESINRPDAKNVVLYKVMGKAMNSESKAVFWTRFIFGELPMPNIMALGYQFPHIHPELEAREDLQAPIIRDQLFGVIDKSPSGNVIAAADGSIEGAIWEQVLHADKKIHLYDETVDRFIQEVTPEKEAAATALTADYPFLISAGTHEESGVNTIMRNPATYQFRQPYVFNLNPEDAADMGFADGQWVRVSTKAGSIKIPVAYSYKMPHGYGNITHHFGLADETGKAYGDAVNKLTAAEDQDEIAGDATYRYIPCRVEALKDGEEFGVWNHE